MRTLADLLRAIGLKTSPLPVAPPKHEEIRIYLALGDVRVDVGRLRRDGSDFVFIYSNEFIGRKDLPPIPDLPEKHRTYRSPVLWPFFLARLPPTDRPDVQKQLEEKGIEAGDTLEVLGQLGKKAISSPYDLELISA